MYLSTGMRVCVGERGGGRERKGRHGAARCVSLRGEVVSSNIEVRVHAGAVRVSLTEAGASQEAAVGVIIVRQCCRCASVHAPCRFIVRDRTYPAHEYFHGLRRPPDCRPLESYIVALVQVGSVSRGGDACQIGDHGGRGEQGCGAEKEPEHGALGQGLARGRCDVRTSSGRDFPSHRVSSPALRAPRLVDISFSLATQELGDSKSGRKRAAAAAAARARQVRANSRNRACAGAVPGWRVLQGKPDWRRVQELGLARKVNRRIGSHRLCPWPPSSATRSGKALAQ